MIHGFLFLSFILFSKPFVAQPQKPTRSIGFSFSPVSRQLRMKSSSSSSLSNLFRFHNLQKNIQRPLSTVFLLTISLLSIPFAVKAISSYEFRNSCMITLLRFSAHPHRKPKLQLQASRVQLAEDLTQNHRVRHFFF